MFKKIRKFTALSTVEKKLFLEAYVMLGLMRAAILTVSFKRLTRSLEHHIKKKSLPEVSQTQMKTAEKIGKAIMKAATYTPWESACLAQSLTAQKMLRKRGIAGVFYLGVRKEVENPNNLNAHAWTGCGDRIITGEKGIQSFTILSEFVWYK
jgi:hypothetical protein